MQNCGISKGVMGHEFSLKLLLVGIKVLNHPKIIKYILYFKTIALKPCIPCIHCCLATENIDLVNNLIFHKCLVARQP